MRHTKHFGGRHNSLNNSREGEYYKTGYGYESGGDRDEGSGLFRSISQTRNRSSQYSRSGVHRVELEDHETDLKEQLLFGENLSFRDNKLNSKLLRSAKTWMPSVEVRFQNVQLAIDLQVDNSGMEIKNPTVATTLKQILKGGSKSKSLKSVPLLKGVTGIFRPHTMTLILGTPGSGKSSLMKILSNTFPLTDTVMSSGKITFNGFSLDDIGNRLPRYVSYVNHSDDHYPTLTVLETFDFAHKCTSGTTIDPMILEAILRPDGDAADEDVKEAVRASHPVMPNVMCEMLGLEKCQDTTIGDIMNRGLSGGEKKRVTTGEALFGNKPVLFLDEITTGLDSTAAYDILNNLRKKAKTLGTTIVVALLQPLPELYELFDEILLLHQGEIVYHGPRESVVPYFESLGCRCPTTNDIPNYLLDLISSRLPYQQSETFLPPELPSHVPTTSREFVASFQESTFYQNTLYDISTGYKLLDKEYYREYMTSLTEFRMGYFESLETLLSRQIKLQLREKTYLIGRMMMIILTACLYGTAFWRIPLDHPQVTLGFMFFSVLFIALCQVPQLPTFMQTRHIFYKQRDANFFRTSTFTLSIAIAQVPQAAIDSLLYSTIAYWMTSSLSGAWTRFWIFVLVLFLLNLCFTMFFFFLASISPNLTIGEPLSILSIFFVTTLAGFIITQDLIPFYWLWMYWISPVSWALIVLANSQFGDQQYNICEYSGIQYCKTFNKTLGEYVLSANSINSGNEWVGYGILYLLAFFIGFIFLSTLVLENIRYTLESRIKEEQNNDKDSLAKENSIEQMTNRNSNNNILMKTIENKNYYYKEEFEEEMKEDIETIDPRKQQKEVHFEEEEFHIMFPSHIEINQMTLAFVDIRYSMKSRGKELNLIRGVTGYAKPGTMTALMGPSGAGKTTLLDILASRKTGVKHQGKILLNGQMASDLAIQRSTGYCEQMDIHSSTSTVKEALLFSAYLRQAANVSHEDKQKNVQVCLELLHLDKIADYPIYRCSKEQLKRLSIGVEMAAMPSILLLDEPTSGLDHHSATRIMKGIRNIASTGRTVICAIHQPSSEVFALFDVLLLLNQCGETVFFGELGENATFLMEYLEECIPENDCSMSKSKDQNQRHPSGHSYNKKNNPKNFNTPHNQTPTNFYFSTSSHVSNHPYNTNHQSSITSSHHHRSIRTNPTSTWNTATTNNKNNYNHNTTRISKEDYYKTKRNSNNALSLNTNLNPLMWFLEAIHYSTDMDFPQIFANSQVKEQMDEELERIYLERNPSQEKKLEFAKKRSANLLTQVYYLGLRFGRLYWRTPSYNLTRFFFMIALALLFGSLFQGTEYTSFTGINSGVGMIFLSTATIGVTATASILPIAFNERCSLYRERACQTYNAFAYFLAAALIEIPYVFSSLFLYTAVFFPLVGFTGAQQFFMFWITLSIHDLFFVFLGQTLAYALPSPAVADLVAALFFTITILFSGYNPPGSKLPHGYEWLYQLSPYKYTTSTLTAEIFSYCSFTKTNNSSFPSRNTTNTTKTLVLNTSLLGCQQLTETPPEWNQFTVKKYTETNFRMLYNAIGTNILCLLALCFVINLIALGCLRYLNYQKK